MKRKSDNQLRLEREYRRRNPDGHWFDTATMKFFSSIIHDIKEVGESIYFISSELPPNSNRVYSVRKMDKKGEIHTVIYQTTYGLCQNKMRTL